MRARLASAFKVITAQTLIDRVNQRGKVPLLEILINCAEVGRAIRAGLLADLPEVMKKNRGLGTQSADMGLRDMLNKNLISEEDALFHATDRDAVVSRRAVRT
jgi:twitching motility protein PilT